jgi:polysaccharide export outer membrane protein
MNATLELPRSRPPLRRWQAGLAGLLLLLLLAAGCSSGSPTSGGAYTGVPPAASVGGEPSGLDRLRKDDMVQVTFSGIPSPPPDHEERIKEDGTVTLQLIGSVTAAGLTAGELQKQIHDKYVPAYYQRLTVTVKTENRVFFVDGEVRQPNRYVYTGEMSVLRAISAAGGFTDFAAKRRVTLVRSGKPPIRVDAERAMRDPAADLPVYPGDRIVVPRREVFGR